MRTCKQEVNHMVAMVYEIASIDHTLHGTPLRVLDKHAPGKEPTEQHSWLKAPGYNTTPLPITRMVTGEAVVWSGHVSNLRQLPPNRGRCCRRPGAGVLGCLDGFCRCVWATPGPHAGPLLPVLPPKCGPPFRSRCCHAWCMAPPLAGTAATSQACSDKSNPGA